MFLICISKSRTEKKPGELNVEENEMDGGNDRLSADDGRLNEGYPDGIYTRIHPPPNRHIKV